MKLGERHSKSLRHGLYLKAQDTELLHDWSHTSRHHSQVLATNQHIACSDECWKLLHRPSCPEVIVPAEVEVLIQTDECILLELGKIAPSTFSDDTYARVIEVGLLGVWDEKLRLERHSVRFYLLDAHGKCRRELPEKSRFAALRNLPNAEETEDVVNSVGTEILFHVSESLLPPEITICRHSFPIIGREAPVLAVSSEIIRRSTCRHVHVEEMRLVPSLDTTRTYANRQVSLQEDSKVASIIGCLLELLVKQVLDECIKANFRGMTFYVLRYGTSIVARKRFPFGEIGCSISVPQMAEDLVRLEPFSILLSELLNFEF